MLNWLRKILLKWLRESRPPSRIIRVWEGDHQVSMEAVGIIGTGLHCRSEHGETVVIASRAVDSEHFYALWEHLGGCNVRWEDGSVFDPRNERLF